MKNQNEIQRSEINFKSINCNSFREFQKKYHENILKLILMPLEKMKKAELCEFINHNSDKWFSGAQLRHKKDYLVDMARDYYEKSEYINIRRQHKIANVLE